MRIFSLAILLFVASLAEAKSIVCFNKQFGRRPLEMTFDANQSTFGFAGKTCTLTRIAYNPDSSQYQGWIRFADKNVQDSNYKTACDPVMAAYYKQNNPDARETPGVHWISVSKEVQATGQGSLQLGYENIWDPGAGGTAKAFMGCYPDKKKLGVRF